MFHSAIIDPHAPAETTEIVRKLLRQRHRKLHFSGRFYMTKKGSENLDFRLNRELEVEARGFSRLESSVNWSKILRRYQDSNPKIEIKENYKPDTFAVSLESCNSHSITKYNVFLPFPRVLNAEIDIEHCTLEFVDKWKNFFENCITPAAKKALHSADFKHYQNALGSDIAGTAYVFSLLHELSHRFGGFRVIPTRNPKISISRFQEDFLGELQANALVVAHVPELEDLGLFWFFHHIFLHARWGTSNDLKYGWIMKDNDSCLGFYLIEKALKDGIIFEHKDKFSIRYGEIHAFSRDVVKSLNDLTDRLELNPKQTHESIVWDWLKECAPYSSESGFHFSAPAQRLFSMLTGIPEAVTL